MSLIKTATATITSGTTDSSVVDIRDYSRLGLIMPAAFTGTALKFEVSDSAGGTFQPLHDSTGTEVTLTVAAGKSYDLPSALGAFSFCKLVSGTAEGGDRTLTLILKRF